MLFHKLWKHRNVGQIPSKEMMGRNVYATNSSTIRTLKDFLETLPLEQYLPKDLIKPKENSSKNKYLRKKKLIGYLNYHLLLKYTNILFTAQPKGLQFQLL